MAQSLLETLVYQTKKRNLILGHMAQKMFAVRIKDDIIAAVYNIN